MKIKGSKVEYHYISLLLLPRDIVSVRDFTYLNPFSFFIFYVRDTGADVCTLIYIYYLLFIYFLFLQIASPELFQWTFSFFFFFCLDCLFDYLFGGVLLRSQGKLIFLILSVWSVIDLLFLTTCRTLFSHVWGGIINFLWLTTCSTLFSLR